MRIGVQDPRRIQLDLVQRLPQRRVVDDLVEAGGEDARRSVGWDLARVLLQDLRHLEVHPRALEDVVALLLDKAVHARPDRAKP